MVKIVPLHDRVVIERVEAESQKGRILIPDAAKERPQEGKVVAVGRGRLNGGERPWEHVPLDVKVGDRILFGKYSGTEIKLDGQEYLILKEEEILAKLLN